MAPRKRIDPKDTQTPALKKRKAGEGTSQPVEGTEEVPPEETTGMEIEVAGTGQEIAPPEVEDVPPPEPETEELFKAISSRIKTYVPPELVNRLSHSQVIGHMRPLNERILTARYYTINVTNFRDAMSSTLTSVLTMKYHDLGRLIGDEAKAEIDMIVPLTVDACMTALYGKLRTIHKQYGAYSQRFNTPSSYNKDIELPVPLADAISDFGVFESKCMTKCHIYVPVYPENTKFEGRVTEEWSSYKYESCIQLYRELGIPCKNVDTRVKTGSAWWTYKVKYSSNCYSGTMIVPPLHYTDNSATIASMFLATKTENDVEQFLPIIASKTDDSDYGRRFQLLRNGTQIRAFLALAAMPDEDWNAGSALV